MLVISLRISPSLITCFNVEETETGIEESLAQFIIDYSQDSYVAINHVKCHGAHILNISLKVRCWKCSEIQFQRKQFSKFSWGGMPP